MLLSNAIKFQKTLALAASASNVFEAEAAELAARRLMEMHNIDPTIIPNPSLYNRMNFGDNALLQKLRSEWREQHPLPTPVIKENKKAYKDHLSIPFNPDGFRKHAYKKKKKKTLKQRAKLTRKDYEDIRLLLNEGHSPTVVAHKLSTPERPLEGSTINSTRAWHLRLGKWIRDDQGYIHWSSGSLNDHEPTAANPQPILANCERNDSTSLP